MYIFNEIQFQVQITINYNMYLFLKYSNINFYAELRERKDKQVGKETNWSD